MTDNLEAWARAPPPPSGPLWSRIGKVFYNPEDKSILGRTPKRWGIMLTFYLIFYVVLAAMFAICMASLLSVLHEDRPYYTMERSLIGANPGVTGRPWPERDFTLQYSVENGTYQEYIQQLDTFLKPYGKEIWLASKNGCNSEDQYGYPYSPCFFVKLNKIFDWTPDYYDDSANLPADMPQDLKDHIKGLGANELKQVWVSCVEEVKNSTKIEYPWGRHLLGRFPFQNKQGHPGPILPVKFTPPVNNKTTIRCRAWAKNIIYNKSLKDGSGYVRVEFDIQEESQKNGVYN